MKLTAGVLREIIRQERAKILLEIDTSSTAITGKGAIELLAKFPKFLAHIGVQDPSKLKILATGTHGTALATPHGKVLKVTDDAREADASSTIAGKGHPGLVHIDGVWKLNDTGAYAILQEHLQPLSSGEAKEFNDALITTGLPIWISRSPDGGWDSVKEMTKKYVKSKLAKDPQYAEKANAAYGLLTGKYGIKQLHETLMGMGIRFHDYQADNLMKRDDGSYVLIDLGNSRGGSGKVETITELRRRLTKQ